MSTQNQYDAVITEARTLMLAKNSDYGDAWRLFRDTTFTDHIHAKIHRVLQMEDLASRGESPAVSEGRRAELMDILNYCAFAIAKMDEKA